MMFEKAKSFSAFAGAGSGDQSSEESIRLRMSGGLRPEQRLPARNPRRATEALRAVEWSELTARLNAARDLRLLLRTESQSPIEVAAASFGDAAASYFALLDDSEPDVNLDALGQSKALGARVGSGEANRPGEPRRPSSDAPRGDARDKQ
ncbi:hypothetical protein [Erythrobacter sp. R86502]|uniref:hypothetical protein n=1 Tax=Erythrobacter sp. R86502 TaxID=3093846 RepID=UPI0036D28DC7